MNRIYPPLMVNRVGSLIKTTTTSKTGRNAKYNKHDRLLKKFSKMKLFLHDVERNFVCHPSWNRCVALVFDRLLKTYEGNGPDQAAKWMKNSRLAYTRFITGRPLESVEYVTLSKSGLPLWLGSDVSQNPSKLELRMWLTLLSVSRVITTKPVLDVQSIVEPSKYTETDISESELLKATRELGIGRFLWKWDKFHLTTKSGPNGQALATAVADLNRLPQRLRDALKLLGGKVFYGKVLAVANKAFKSFWQESFSDVSKNRYRKLSYFADKESKTRVIAIMDYWTQTVLKSLHDRLNWHLRKIDSDCTYNQDHFTEVLKSGPYHSLDLKSATDRMPVKFQQRVISKLVGPIRAARWVEILTDFPFESDAGKVKYLAGQPMGAYSSWPAMALTHHVIVRIAANRVGLHNFSNYALLGDDIVIGSDKVADSYRALLKTLDMPISEAKTHTCDYMYEFAKRWIYKGEEVSAFAVSGLLETWSRYPLFNNFLETQLRNGWEFRDSKGPSQFLRDIMSSMGRFQQGKRTVKLHETFNLLKTFILTGDSSVPEKLWTLWNPAGVRPDNMSEWLTRIIKRIYVEQAKKDNVMLQDAFVEYLTFTAEQMIKYVERHTLPAKETSLLWNAFRFRHPIPQLFDYRMKSITKQLKDVQTGNITFMEVFTSKEVMTKFWTVDIFTMRQSNSKLFAQARIVKDFLTAISDKGLPINRVETAPFSRKTEHLSGLIRRIAEMCK